MAKLYALHTVMCLLLSFQADKLDIEVASFRAQHEPKLFPSETIDLDSVPYALDHAVTTLRMTGAPPERWATFIHMSA